MLENVAAGRPSGLLAASPPTEGRRLLGRRIYGDVTRRKKLMLGLLGPLLVLLVLADVSFAVGRQRAQRASWTGTSRA